MSNEALAPNGLNLMLQKAINMADPSQPMDGVNLQTLQNYVAGLNWKAEVRVATVTAGTLATDFENGDTIDGIVLSTGDRILIKNQVAGAENGIYTVNASGAPTRATDADTTAELQNAVVPITEGTVSGNLWYQLITDNVIVGTTPQVWQLIQFGIIYTGSNGVVLVGNDFRVQALDGSITVAAGGISTTRQQLGATGKYATDTPALTGGVPSNIVHGLGNADPVIEIYLSSTGQRVLDLGATKVDANTISVVDNTTRASAFYRVAVVG